MNDRLTIAKEIFIERAKGLHPLTGIQFDLEVKFAIDSADALIAAAGDGGKSEIPTSHLDELPLGTKICPMCHGLRVVIQEMVISDDSSNNSEPEPIKSDWSLRGYFATMRKASMRFIGDNTVALDKDQQDAICDLVEKYYGKPANVPSVEEMLAYLGKVGWDISPIVSINAILIDLHNWLTERAEG